MGLLVPSFPLPLPHFFPASLPLFDRGMGVRIDPDDDLSAYECIQRAGHLPPEVPYHHRFRGPLGQSLLIANDHLVYSLAGCPHISEIPTTQDTLLNRGPRLQLPSTPFRQGQFLQSPKEAPSWQFP